MAEFFMQARSSADGQLYTWTQLGEEPDFSGTGFPGPPSPEDIVVALRPSVGADEVVTKDDIGRSDGSTIDRVQGIHGAAIAETRAPTEALVFDGEAYAHKKPAPPGHFDVFDYRALGYPNDDADAFDAAIAAMTAYEGPIQAKLIAHGRFYLSRTLHFTRSFVFEGLGCAEGDISPAGNRTFSGTLLCFPNDTTGIRLHSACAGDTPGATTQRPLLRDIWLTCIGNGATTSGHGIHSQVTVTLENVGASYFGDNGLFIFGDHSLPSPDNDEIGVGNASASHIVNCVWTSNKRHGIHIKGGDASICSIVGGEVTGNDGWGVFEEGGLGNNYYSVHAESNKGYEVSGPNRDFSCGVTDYRFDAVQNPLTADVESGSTIVYVHGPRTRHITIASTVLIAGVTGWRQIASLDHLGDEVPYIEILTAADATVTGAELLVQTPIPTNHSTFVGCYSEASRNRVMAPATVIGGLLALSNQDGTATTLSGSSGFVNGISTITESYYDPNDGVTLLRRTLTELGAINSTHVLSYSQLDVPGQRELDKAYLYFDNADSWWKLSISQGGADRIAMAHASHNTTERRWGMAFPNGVLFGTPSRGYNAHIAAYDPTTTDFDPYRAWDDSFQPMTFEVGDFVWNRVPTSTGILGWLCTTAGTETPTTWNTVIHCTTTEASADVTLDEYQYLYPGQYITIPGVTGRKKILSRVGYSMTLDSVCDAAVEGAVLAFVAPVYTPIYVNSANSLKSATTTVAVSAATAPTLGQVLTATSPTTAEWRAGVIVDSTQLKAPAITGHLLLRNTQTNTATRVHIEPNGHPSGTKSKLDLMFDPYDDDATNYRIVNVFTEDATTGQNGVAVLGVKGVGDQFGIWPSLNVGFSDNNANGVPLKVMYFDTSDSAWRTPMRGMWREGLAVTSGDYALANSKLYQAGTTATTGSTKPSHGAGTVSDGVVDWTFVRDFAAAAASIKPVVVLGDRDDLPKFGLATYRTQVSKGAVFWNTIPLSFLGSTDALAWNIYTKVASSDLYIEDAADSAKFMRFGSSFIQTGGLSKLLGTTNFTNNNATPNVQGAEIAIFANTNPTTVTAMTGFARQRLTVIAANGNTTLANGANIVTNTGADKVLRTNEVLELLFDAAGTTAVEIGAASEDAAVTETAVDLQIVKGTHRCVVVTVAGKTVTLPATPTNGESYEVANHSAMDITVNGGGHNIGLLATETIAPYASRKYRYAATSAVWIRL